MIIKYLIKGKYPYSGQDPSNVGTMFDINHISQPCADKPKQIM